jgi:hypothetical protein
MKPVADDTIYRTKDGTRVRIVKEKEVNRGQVSPMVYDMVVESRKNRFVVAEVKNGKRWYGYKLEDLTPEK